MAGYVHEEDGMVVDWRGIACGRGLGREEGVYRYVFLNSSLRLAHDVRFWLTPPYRRVPTNNAQPRHPNTHLPLLNIQSPLSPLSSTHPALSTRNSPPHAPTYPPQLAISKTLPKHPPPRPELKLEFYLFSGTWGDYKIYPHEPDSGCLDP